jgi:Translation initiation factor 1A / IF-1
MIVRHDLIEAELVEQLPLISIEPPSSSASLTNRSRLADDARSHEVHCHISGKMHAHHIRIAAGDDVLVEMGALRPWQGAHCFRAACRECHDDVLDGARHRGGGWSWSNRKRR